MPSDTGSGVLGKDGVVLKNKRATTNYIRWKQVRAFPLKSGATQKWPFSPLTVIATAISQDSTQGHTNRKGKGKLSLLADDMILYLESLLSRLENSWP